MIITSILADEKNKELAVLLMEDGRLLRTLSEEVVRLGLRAGDNLDEQQERLLEQSAGKYSARRAAVNALSQKQYSRKGLEERLVGKGVDPAEAAAAALWLEQIGLINDENYARSALEYYSKKGMGARRIAQEMAKRGISRELAEEVLAGAEPDGAIDKFIARRLKGRKPDREDMRRLSGALARRGHSWEDISRALRRAMSENDEK